MHVYLLIVTSELTYELGLQVGGVHFNLLSKVRRDIGETLSLDRLIDSIFPTFRTNIEPDLHHAQVLHLIVIDYLLHSFMVASIDI